jgi:hypothetical protein
MKEQLLSPIPAACARTQAEIQADPLALSAEASAHVARCTACFETQVAWLAQQDAEAQAPAGYFERLPDRILGKLPARPHRQHSRYALWALAAGLLMAAGAGGFLAGRANRTPVVEASLAQPVPAQTAQDLHENFVDTPFQEGEDDYVQLADLNHEQAKRLVERVRGKAARP